jgi:hypothetical protein
MAVSRHDTIYQLLGEPEFDIRQSYTGGAVDVYIPHNFNLDPHNFNLTPNSGSGGVAPRQSREPTPSRIGEKLFYYDVNSLYPFVMANAPLPVGKPIAFTGDITQVDPDAYGFFFCKIETPSYLEHPILQRKIKTDNGMRTIAGLGAYEGWVFSEEIKYCKPLGYKFEIVKGYKFKKSTTVFKSYVEKMYELRQQYSKGHPLNLIAKLLMNSLYGKFGMKPTKNVVEIFNLTKEDETKQLSEFLSDFGESIDSYTVLESEFVIIDRKDVSNYSYTESQDMFFGLDINVALASAITASGRIFMGRFKNNSNFKLYYSDTDSIIINRELKEEIVGNKLGQLKLEHEILIGIFLAPKVYYFIDSEGKPTVKIKGITKDALNRLKPSDLGKLLYKDHFINVDQEKWYKDLFSGKISVSQIAYQLKVTSNKRKNIYLNNVFSTTKPYYYNEIDCGTDSR